VLVTSYFSGLVGAGGTLIMIPSLIYVVPFLSGRHLDIHVITSLGLVQGITVGVGGGYQHWRKNRLSVTSLETYGGVLAFGGILGAWASAKASPIALVAVLALLASVAATFLAINPQLGTHQRTVGRSIVAGILFLVVGFVGGLVGVGAGFLTAPLLIYWLGLDMRTASATALVFTLILCAPALTARAVTGQVDWSLAGVTAACAVLGAAFGSIHSGRFAPEVLRFGLAAVTTALALKMWVSIAFGLD